MPKGRKKRTPFYARLLPGDYPPRTSKKMRGSVKRILYRFPQEKTEVEFFGEAPPAEEEVLPDELLDELPPAFPIAPPKSNPFQPGKYHGVSDLIVPIVFGAAVVGMFALAYWSRKKQS